MDVSDLLPNASLEVLKNCLVGRWKTIPDPAPIPKELEAWARTIWRLRGNVLFMMLNKDLFLLKFVVLDDTKRVLEEGKRNFRGNLLL